MILAFIFHPVILTIILAFCIWWLRDLIVGGGKTHAIKKSVLNHINDMGQQKTEKAWDGLSFELKVKLTDKKRLKKGGKLYVGARRVADFSARHSSVYNKANLVVDSITRIRRVKGPKQMYVIRMRSKLTGTIRLSVWVSYVPMRADGWGVTDVCVHPANGQLGKGDTLTGAKITAPQPVTKAPKKSGKNPKKKKKKRRSLKDDAA
jgi:hypothetical protein